MAHHNTVFAQMLKFIPTCLSRQVHEFESLANQHHSGRRLCKMTRLRTVTRLETILAVLAALNLEFQITARSKGHTPDIEDVF